MTKSSINRSLSANDSLLYVKRPKFCTRNQYRTNKANHQIKKSLQKLVALLYSSSRLFKLEMKGVIAFTTDTDAQ